MKCSYLTLFIIFFPFFATAQNKKTATVIQDSRIDSLINHFIEYNKIQNQPDNEGNFQLQISPFDNRNNAFDARSRIIAFLPKNSNKKCIIFFQSPYFKLRIYSFDSFTEANEYKSKIENIFNHSIGVYIVKNIKNDN